MLRKIITCSNINNKAFSTLDLKTLGIITQKNYFFNYIQIKSNSKIIYNNNRGSTMNSINIYKNKNNYFLKINKKGIFENTDNSYLHVETTDIIYPKIKKYNYELDSSALDETLKEFIYLYEKNNFEEALNIGYRLLNVYEANSACVYQMINLCTYLADIFIKIPDLELAQKILFKAERKLNLDLFKKDDKENLYIEYFIKLQTLQGLVYCKFNKHKEAFATFDKQDGFILAHFKEFDKSLTHKPNYQYVFNELLKVACYKALINKNSSIENYKRHIMEMISFFESYSSKDFKFNSQARVLLIQNSLDLLETKEVNIPDSQKAKILDIASAAINTLKNKELITQLNIKKDYIILSNKLQAGEYKNSVFEMLNDLSAKIISLKHLNQEKYDLELRNFHEEKQNLIINHLLTSSEWNAWVLKSDLEYFKFIKNNLQLDDKIFLSKSYSHNKYTNAIAFLSFYRNYKAIADKKLIQRMLEFSLNTNFLSKNKTSLEDLLEIFNYKILFLKNEKIMEKYKALINEVLVFKSLENPDSHKQLQDASFSNTNGIMGKNSSEKDLFFFNQISYSRTDLQSIRILADFLTREKIKYYASIREAAPENLNKLLQFFRKQLNYLMQENNIKLACEKDDKARAQIRLENVVLYCLYFEQIKNKTHKSKKYFFVFLKKYFEILYPQAVKPIRHASLDSVKINLFSFKDLKANKFASELITSIEPKASLFKASEKYSNEEISETFTALSLIAVSFYRLAEENYSKLIFYCNNAQDQAYSASYFKNSLIIKNNFVNKNINSYSDISIRIALFVLHNKNDLIKAFINSEDEKNILLVEELKKCLVLNYVLKIYLSLYFTNCPIQGLKDSLRDNRDFIEEFTKNKSAIKVVFDDLENLLNQSQL